MSDEEIYNENMKTIFSDSEMYPKFVIDITTEKDEEKYGMSFKLYQVNTWVKNDDGKPIPEEIELYIYGWIKQDGCADLKFGDNGYIHFCGFSFIEDHCLAVKYLYKFAKENIEGFYGD